MTEDTIIIEFGQQIEDIAYRITLLSDDEIKDNLKEYTSIMKAFCKKVMPKLFGAGKYKMDVTDNGYDGAVVSFTCDTPHPDKFANTENVISIEQHCPENMTELRQRQLFALVCMFKSMFTKASKDEDHRMPFNGHWTLDVSSAEMIHKQPKIQGFNGCTLMTESVISQVVNCPDLKTLDDVKKHFGIKHKVKKEHAPAVDRKEAAEAQLDALKKRIKASQKKIKTKTSRSTKKSKAVSKKHVKKAAAAATNKKARNTKKKAA